jgi:poly(A) polymerase
VLEPLIMDDTTIDPEQDRTDDLAEPLIFPRAEHPISRKNIDREALKVMYRLRDAGFTAYLVGGGVRDLFLSKTPKDFDISTDARPGELRKLFRNSRIIGRRFRLVQVFFHGGKIIEVSTFRRRSEFDELNGESEVLASNNTFGSPAEDAFRRDLTINSLFYEIEKYTVIDYTGGVADLRHRIIRFIGDPDRRLIRDPVRMLRAVRHAARSGFEIEEASWQAIKRHGQELALCPVSRIRDELLKDLRAGASRDWLGLAVASGLLPVVLPCYEALLPESAVGKTAPEATFGLLSRLAGVSDRLHREGQQLPDHFLFALWLIPWAVDEFKIMEERRGEETNLLTRAVRQGLDGALDRLNVKRAAKEAITILLLNLATFQRYAEKGSWPKWLRKKSYFKEGRQFFRIYQEAIGGEPVEAVNLAPPPKLRPRMRARGKGSKLPAFASGKGGVFGLKKK